MSRILKVLDSIRTWRSVTCEACGGDFNCGATLKGCWCSEISLSDESRAELRARYTGCLCRACLEGFASAEKDQGD